MGETPHIMLTYQEAGLAPPERRAPFEQWKPNTENDQRHY